MTEEVYTNEAPPFENNLEIAKYPNFTIVYGYRDPDDKIESEQRIFVVPLNKIAEQVLKNFANEKTIPMPKTSFSEKFSAVSLKGKFSEILKQLNEVHSTEKIPSMGELEAHIKQTKIENAGKQEKNHNLPTPKEILTKLKGRMGSAAEITENQEKRRPAGEVAKALLNEAQQKLVEKLKELKILKIEVKNSTAVSFLVIFLLISLGYAIPSVNEVIKGAKYIGTEDYLLQNIIAVFKEVSTWDPSLERSGLLYLPIISSIISLILTIGLISNFRIKKK